MRALGICGSRDWADRETLQLWMNRIPAATLVFVGDCKGADAMAYAYAKDRRLDVTKVPVDELLDGPWPGAGPRRNQRLVDAARCGGHVTDLRWWSFTWAMPTPSGVTQGSGDCLHRALFAGAVCTIIPPGSRP